MGIPRAYSPTPLFLFQSGKNSNQTAKPLFTDFKQDGIGTPLFKKGRGCLAFLLSVFKDIYPEKNEVLIPAYNAQSLAFATIHNGLKIKLVDIQQKSFFPSYEQYLNSISDKVLAAILPYNWGVFPEINELIKITDEFKKNHIFWIDDFASSYPLNDHLQYFKMNSPCQFFSFGKTKTLSLIDGGYAFIPQSSLYYKLFHETFAKANSEKILISKKKYDISKTIENFLYHIYTNRIGYSILSYLGPGRNDHPPKTSEINMEIQSVGWENTLEKIIETKLNETLQYRLNVNKKYHQHLTQLNNSQLHLFSSTLNNVGSRFPLLFRSKEIRDEVRRKLIEKQIGVSTGHDKWLNEIELIRPFLNNIREENYPEAVEFQHRLLTLPAHERVDKKSISIICDIIKKILV